METRLYVTDIATDWKTWFTHSRVGVKYQAYKIQRFKTSISPRRNYENNTLIWEKSAEPDIPRVFLSTFRPKHLHTKKSRASKWHYINRKRQDYWRRKANCWVTTSFTSFTMYFNVVEDYAYHPIHGRTGTVSPACFSFIQQGNHVLRPNWKIFTIHLGPVARKFRILIGPEKSFVKLRPAYSVKLVFSYVVNGIKI